MVRKAQRTDGAMTEKQQVLYLWLAEIEVETGSLEQARTYVNLLRARASNPDGFVPSNSSLQSPQSYPKS